MAAWLNGLTILGVGVLAWTGAAPALAQTEPTTIPEGLEDIVNTYSGDFFHNRSLGRQIQVVTGLSFRDRELDWDVNALHQAYTDLQRLQNTLDPTLRVPDLPNPYATTLLTLPSGGASLGSEFIFEPTP